MSLERLNWSHCEATLEGTEKIDFLVPIQLENFGTMTLKMSGMYLRSYLKKFVFFLLSFLRVLYFLQVAICLDTTLPNILSDVTEPFLREGGQHPIFWPPSTFHDQQALPRPWLSMLSTTESLTEELSDAFDESGIEESALKNSTETVVQQKNNIQVPYIVSSDDDFRKDALRAVALATGNTLNDPDNEPDVSALTKPERIRRSIQMAGRPHNLSGKLTAASISTKSSIDGLFKGEALDADIGNRSFTELKKVCCALWNCVV